MPKRVLQTRTCKNMSLLVSETFVRNELGLRYEKTACIQSTRCAPKGRRIHHIARKCFWEPTRTNQFLMWYPRHLYYLGFAHRAHDHSLPARTIFGCASAIANTSIEHISIHSTKYATFGDCPQTWPDRAESETKHETKQKKHRVTNSFHGQRDDPISYADFQSVKIMRGADTRQALPHHSRPQSLPQLVCRLRWSLRAWFIWTRSDLIADKRTHRNRWFPTTRFFETPG